MSILLLNLMRYCNNGETRKKLSDIEYLNLIGHGRITDAKIRHIGFVDISQGVGTTDPANANFEKVIGTVPDGKDWYLISWKYHYKSYYANSLVFKFITNDADSHERIVPRTSEDHHGMVRGLLAAAGTEVKVSVSQSKISSSVNTPPRYLFAGYVSMTVLEVPAGTSPETPLEEEEQ